MKENSRWNNDAIQFPRLLAEIAATGALTPAVYDELRDLTDLTNDEINQLLDRAQTAWEKIKTEHCPPEQDSFGTRTKPPQDREAVMTEWDESSKFRGVDMPRFESQPNGPQMQSMVLCVCGAYWKDHRFVDGACPKQQEVKS